MITEIKIEFTNHYALMYRFYEPVDYKSYEMQEGFIKLMEFALDDLIQKSYIESLWYRDAEDDTWWRI